MPKMLLVEDDPVVRAAVTHTLSRLGHEVRAVGSAAVALRDVTAEHFDLVLLDLMLPDLDGVAALRILRRVSDVPVIVATARGSEASIIASLNAGADDYLVKPFSGEHLVARINALLRRARGESEVEDRRSAIVVGELRIDIGRRVATLADRPLALNRREFDLLLYLALRHGQVVTRSELARAVWDQPYLGDDKTINVHASWLRRKLGENAAHPRYLHTVRGVGLRLEAPG